LVYHESGITCQIVFIRVRRRKMNKTPAFYIFVGLLLGAALGAGIGAVHGHTVDGLQLGAAVGTFIGWVITAPALQK
jgi:hypothetical protein